MHLKVCSKCLRKLNALNFYSALSHAYQITFHCYVAQSELFHNALKIVAGILPAAIFFCAFKTFDVKSRVVHTKLEFSCVSYEHDLKKPYFNSNLIF